MSTLQILTKTWNRPHNQVSVTKDAGNQMISGGRTDINQNFQKNFLEKSEKNMDNVVREDLVKTRMRVIDPLQSVFKNQIYWSQLAIGNKGLIGHAWR